MSKLVSLGVVSLLVVSLSVLEPTKSTAAKPKWEKGWVSDSKCGAKGAGIGHEECGKKCLAAHEQVVFVNGFSHRVLNVDNPDFFEGSHGARCGGARSSGRDGRDHSCGQSESACRERKKEG